jgi:uncharacterized protein YlxW (UPF0749 family)
MRYILILLILFSLSFAQPYSDVRLEIISKIKKLQEEKSKIKDKEKIKKINREIENLKKLLDKYEESNITAG